MGNGKDAKNAVTSVTGTVSLSILSHFDIRASKQAAQDQAAQNS